MSEPNEEKQYFISIDHPNEGHRTLNFSKYLDTFNTTNEEIQNDEVKTELIEIEIINKINTNQDQPLDVNSNCGCSKTIDNKIPVLSSIENKSFDDVVTENPILLADSSDDNNKPINNQLKRKIKLNTNFKKIITNNENTYINQNNNVIISGISSDDQKTLLEDSGKKTSSLTLKCPISLLSEIKLLDKETQLILINQENQLYNPKSNTVQTQLQCNETYQLRILENKSLYSVIILILILTCIMRKVNNFIISVLLLLLSLVMLA